MVGTRGVAALVVCLLVALASGSLQEAEASRFGGSQTMLKLTGLPPTTGSANRDTMSMRCEPAVGSSEGLIALEAVPLRFLAVDACKPDASKEMALEGAVVMWTLTGSEQCSFWEGMNVLLEAKPAAVVLINWLKEPVLFPFRLDTRTVHVPVCMISLVRGQVVEEALTPLGQGKMTATLFNGELLRLTYHTTAMSRTRFFADGKRLPDYIASQVLPQAAGRGQAIVKEDYMVLAVELTPDAADAGAESQGPSFHVFVEDDFGTGAAIVDAWHCAPLEDAAAGPGDWMHPDYVEDPAIWQAPAIAPDTLDTYLLPVPVPGRPTACRGKRWLVPFRIGWREIFLNRNLLGWEAASARCVERGGQLISSHRARDDALLTALVRVTGLNVWFGLVHPATPRVIMEWSDRSVLDHVNTASYSEHTATPDIMSCFGVDHTGTWVRAPSCDERQPSVCARVVYDTTPWLESNEICMINFGRYTDSFGPVISAPPKLSLAPESVCRFGSSSQLSCCTDDWMESRVKPEVENSLQTWLVSEEQVDEDEEQQAGYQRCATFMREVGCWSCDASQGTYMEFYDQETHVAVCRDTCDTFAQLCEAYFVPKLPGSRDERCKKLFTDTEATNSVRIEEDLYNRPCFRVDATPPRVAESFPAPNSRVAAVANELRLVFTKSMVKTSMLSVIIKSQMFEEPGERGDNNNNTVYKYTYVYSQRRHGEYFWGSPGTLSMQSTYQANDTLVISLSTGSCLFHRGLHQVIVGPSELFDLAGNAFAGNEFIESWFLTSTTTCYVPNFAGVQALVWSLVAVIVVMIAVYLRHARGIMRGDGFMQPVQPSSRPGDTTRERVDTSTNMDQEEARGDADDDDGRYVSLPDEAIREPGVVAGQEMELQEMQSA